jgi:hypothetical protein
MTAVLTAEEPEIVGSTVPRLFTEPLPGRRVGDGPDHGCPCGCALSPETSQGFDVIEWSDRLGLRDPDGKSIILNPWQRWLLIHALEYLPGGRKPRFRTVLVLVARQNGKTMVKAVLTLYRMFVLDMRYLVGTAQDLSQAREVMNEVLVPMVLDNPELRDRFDPDAENYSDRHGIWHKTLNDEYFRLDSRWLGARMVGPHGPRYLIKALNRKAGRGLAGVGEVNIDELREQTDHKGWAAVSKTVLTNDEAQIWCMSNSGDSSSVVLNHLRGVALGGNDPSLFHAEWSAPEGCDLDDLEAWAQANPSLGYTLTAEALRSALLTDPPNVFRTEVLCQSVDVLNTALDAGAWQSCADPAGSGGDGPVALCVETAMEGDQVVAVTAAPLPDGRFRLDVVGVWDSTEKARAGVRELKSGLRPKALGWFPKGPGAALSAALRKLEGVEIKGAAMSEACMTLADYVDGRRIVHPDNPILNDHARHTGTVGSASSWIFDRGPGATHGLWASAGALHLVLNTPAPQRRKRRVLTLDAGSVTESR